MTQPKRPYIVAVTLKIDLELLDALRAIKARDGVSESEQIRRGIRLWLKAKGVKPNADRCPTPSRARQRPSGPRVGHDSGPTHGGIPYVGRWPSKGAEHPRLRLSIRRPQKLYGPADLEMRRR